MNINNAMSTSELFQTQTKVDSFNKTLEDGRVHKSELDKDDFLKILLTQLTHQDPTKPMEDKEFIAQMAQFSSLEQMTNMSNEFSKLSNLLTSGQAVSMLGKNVEIIVGDQLITGIVEEISGREFPQVLVNGKYYDFNQVQKVREQEAAL